MMKNIIVLVLLLYAGLAFCGTAVDADAQIQLSYPDSWLSEYDNGTLFISSPDSIINISFTTMDAQSLDSAMIEVAGTMVQELGELQEGVQSEVEINGLSCWIWDTATKDNAVSASVMLVISPTGKILMVFAAAATDLMTRYDKEISEILQSIKPLEE